MKSRVAPLLARITPSKNDSRVGGFIPINNQHSCIPDPAQKDKPWPEKQPEKK